MDNLKCGGVGLQKLPWSTHCRTREGVSLLLLSSSVSLPGFVFSAGLPLKRVSPNPDQDLWSGGCESVASVRTGLAAVGSPFRAGSAIRATAAALSFSRVSRTG